MYSRIKMMIFCGSLFLMSALSSLASGENRNVAVDQTIGGMEQGRRIQSPGSYNNKGITSGQPGSTTTSAHDIHTISQESEKATASAGVKNITGGNHGLLYVNGQATNSQNGTNQVGRKQTNGSTNANAGQGLTGQENGSANAGSGQAGLPAGQPGSTSQSGESAQVNTGETSTVQTSGSVNVNTGETSTGQTSGSVQTGTVQTTTGQITNPVNTGSAGTTQTVPTETTPTASTSTGGAQEPSGTSSNPIVGVEAGVDQNSGTVNTGVHVDTSGQLEDKQIIDAGATGEGAGSTGAQVGSATGITGSETVHQADITTQPVTGTTGQTTTGETTTVETQGNGGILTGGETSPTGQVTTGEVTTGTGSSGTTTQEPSGTSSNPIVGVEAGVDQNSGMPNAGVTLDTSGQLEERQILDADATGEITGSTGAEVGSAADITDADLVEEADITTEVVSDTTGQAVPDQISGLPAGQANGGTSSGSQTPTEESSGTSSNPIVDLETNINPESGTADVNVGVDTSGELEDRQILAIDLAAEGVGSTGTETGSASGITGSETVHDANVTAPVTTTEQTVSTTTDAQSGTSTVSSETQTSGAVESLIPAPSDFGTEIDTTGQTAGGEADVGIAAEVDGVGEGADVANDPADGLTTSVPGL